MTDKKAQMHSPSYPGIDLEQAIEKARIIWQHAKRNSVSSEFVAKYWKYGEKSSGWRTKVAALKRFGLLESVGNKKSGDVRLTDLAAKIILDVRQPSTERDQAIKQAAILPEIYRELWMHWGGTVPPDDVARTYLTLNKDFNENSVRDFIADFKKTIEFAKLTSSDTIPPADEKDEEDSPDSQAWRAWNMKTLEKPDQSPPAGQPPSPKMRDLPVTMPSSLNVAVIRVPVPMTEKDFKTLIASLTDMKDMLVKSTSE